MKNVIGNSCYPPGKRCLWTANYKISQRTQRSKKQSYHRRKNTPEPDRRIFPKKHGKYRHHRPDICIHRPPVSETIDTALQQNKCRNHIKYSFFKINGEKDNKQCCNFYIRKKCNRLLCHF